MQPQRYELNPIRSKTYTKKFMKSRQIRFGQYVNKKTGEINELNIQITVYVPDGAASPYEPKACMNMKLGKDSIHVISDSLSDVEVFFSQALQFIAEEKTNVDKIVAKERTAYYKHIESLKNANNAS